LDSPLTASLVDRYCASFRIAADLQNSFREISTLVGFFQPNVLRETSISTTLVQENEARNGYRGNRVTGMNYGLNVGSVQGE